MPMANRPELSRTSAPSPNSKKDAAKNISDFMVTDYGPTVQKAQGKSAPESKGQSGFNLRSLKQGEAESIRQAAVRS